MKVLSVVRASTEIGGLERVVAQVGRALTEAGHEHSVIVLGTDVGVTAGYFWQQMTTSVERRPHRAWRAVASADVVHVHVPTMMY